MRTRNVYPYSGRYTCRTGMKKYGVGGSVTRYRLWRRARRRRREPSIPTMDSHAERGGCPWTNRRTNASFTIITSVCAESSSVVKSRPATNGIPSVLK